MSTDIADLICLVGAVRKEANWRDYELPRGKKRIRLLLCKFYVSTQISTSILFNITPTFFMGLAFAEYSIKGADFERRFISNIEYIKRKLSKDTFQHKQH